MPSANSRRSWQARLSPEAQNILRKVAYSGFGSVEEMAPEWGPRLTSYLRRYMESEDKAVGPGIEAMKNILGDVNKKDAVHLQNYMEGKPGASPQVAAKAATVSKMLSDVQDTFESKGLADPANRITNYWPRSYPPEMYAPGGTRNKFLEDMVKTGKAKNLDEAERILSYTRGGGARAGHFERPRRTDLPGDRKDLSVLPETYMQGVRRLTSVDFFGKNERGSE